MPGRFLLSRLIFLLGKKIGAIFKHEPGIGMAARIPFDNAVTEATLKECKRLGLDRMWLQPGSESEAAIAFCHENNLKVVLSYLDGKLATGDNICDH